MAQNEKDFLNSTRRSQTTNTLLNFYQCKTTNQLRQQLIFEALLLILQYLPLTHEQRVTAGILDNLWKLSKDEPVEFNPKHN